MIPFRSLVITCGVVATAAAPACTPLHAQAVVPPAVAAVAKADTAKKAEQPLFTKTDAWIALGFTGLTFALYPVDKSMAVHLQDQNSTLSKSIDKWATGFDYLTLPGVFVLGFGTYAFGRMTHADNMADVAWHTTESVIIGSVITEVVKDVAGRSRPYVTADTNPRDFKVGAGLTNDARKSFPSGHATIAFAAASAVTTEVHRVWPRYALATGIVSYGIASAVGLSRMYQNQHWASDVVVGAGIGTLAGLKTVRYSHLHPDNPVDRFMLHTSIAPDGRGGARLTWSAPIR
jgi:membrane-associated phospholipid phosphatase